MSSQELKPCPFCGSEATMRASLSNLVHAVECNSCFASGPFNYSYPAATEAWNTRQQPEARSHTAALEAFQETKKNYSNCFSVLGDK